MIKRNQKGITLIALVITIIVMLILVSVTISIAVNGGLFDYAGKAVKKTSIEKERETILAELAISQIDEYVEGESTRLGESLYDRTLENGDKWHVVTANGNVYGTNWNYIEKGTDLGDYGETKYSWLVNYQTGEIIELEEDNYINLSAGDMLAVKDSLIINVDSSIVDKDTGKDKKSIEKQLGENVELIGFDEIGTEESGLTNTSFNFDGKNDYIKVQYDKQEQKEELAKKGFTFEFYGIWNGGTTDPHSNVETDGLYRGLFCYWNGNENQQANVRFGIYENANIMSWNAGNYKLLSDYSGSIANPHNIFYKVKLDELRKGAYITITLDTSKSYTVTGEKYTGIGNGNGGDILKEGEYYKQTVYMNGTKIYEGDYNKEAWDNFIKGDLKNLKYFCIGRSSMSKDGWWHYSKMNTYCLRLYSKGLTEEEVKANYEKSVEYHSLLESQ